MRVLAYNIQGGARGIDWVAATIRDIAPDVACLNEVRRKHLRRLAALTKRRAVFLSGSPFSGFGNAILTRERAERVVARRLPRSPGLEGRSLLAVRVRDVVVATTHLGLTSEERSRHAREILAAVPADGPVVLAADLNEGPDDPALVLLRSRFRDAFAVAGSGNPLTFPSTLPDRRIDYVLFDGLEAVSCEVVDAVASDHRPLVADFEREESNVSAS